MKTHPVIGVACVMGAAALWGTTGTAQALAGSALAPVWFGALRLLIAAAFFAVFATATGGAGREAWRGLAWVDVLGAGLCMAAYNLMFFAGVSQTGVAIGTAIALGSGPVWAGLLQAALQRAPPRAAWWAATAVSVAGGVLLSSDVRDGAASSTPWGVVLCLGSGLSYATYTLLNKRMVRNASGATITLGAFGIAAVLAFAAAWLCFGAPTLALREAAAAAYTGIVTAGLAYLLFSHALRHVTSATAVSLALIEPAVAFGLACTVLGEPAGALGIAGLLLVVLGVLGVVRTELALKPVRTL